MMAREKGDTDKANIYNQLAEMKVAAANNAKEGKGYDWAHYYELKKKLHAGNKDCDKPNKDCDKPKREWNASDKPAPTQLNIE